MPRGRPLSLEERVFIQVALRQGLRQSQIAVELGRDRSVICRELARHPVGAYGYRALACHKRALKRRRRPKPARLKVAGPLRSLVIQELAAHHSPQQIAGRLALLFPDRPEMRVSPETIYQAIYLQSRGGLKAEVERALRSGRTRRRPVGERRPGQASRRSWAQPRVSARPAEVADRAVPGHWEGDLLMGAKNGSAIVVLVERTSRFVMLAALPGGWTAAACTAAIQTKIMDLPDRLRATLTWDCGNEMSQHAQFTIATGIDCYFCDPHSPWQKATVENTNGLLRQYFTKKVFDFRDCSQAYLDAVADEMNDRPRKVLGFHTPREELNRHLVALTS